MVNWDLLGCRRKGKLRFSGHSQKTIYRYSAIAVYAFKGPLAEGAGSAVFFFSAETGGGLTLGFVLILALPSSASSAAVAAGSVRRENRAPNGATLLPS